MSDEDVFDSPKLILDRAREHIRELEARSQGFVEGCRGIPIVEFDAQTGEKVHKLRFTQKIPGKLRVIASDALNNLRHSLDQAVNAAAAELGGKRNNYFPFAKDAGDIDRVVKDNCPSLHADIKDLIKTFQPYGGGDDLLYAMSRMSGPDKHQLVLKLNINLPRFPMGAGTGYDLRGQGPMSIGYIAWDGFKQELESARVWGNGHSEYEGEFKMPLFISLSDSHITRGEPAPAFLNTVASKVEGIIAAIEAETARLKAPHVVGSLSA